MLQSIGRTRVRLVQAGQAGSQCVKALVTGTLNWLEPASTRHPWINRVMLIAVLALGGWIGAESLSLPFGILADIVFGMLIALFVISLVRLVLGPGLGLVGLLLRLCTRAGLVGAIATMGLLLLLGLPLQLALLAGLVIGLALLLAGVGVAMLRSQPRKVMIGCVLMLPALLVVGTSLYWLLNEQQDEDPVMRLVDIPEHDGQPWDRYLASGPYQTGFLTYGSGKDRWRPEYADQVTWQTQSVDARDLLERPSGLGLNLRERWWGFGLDSLPINGRVWYPVDAQGRLPLVLIVHGNHDMMHYSDPGYAWLGEHLASRGHIVVSVDQNFINGGLFGGVARENGVRGWLLLEHLMAWRNWQTDPEHDLHERVDLDQVVLIGHSRGGEAAALAAAFNRLQRYPEDGRIEFNYDFGIQGVAAIAPIDGQFWASGKPTELADVSYFVIHGGMDADVYFFSGDRQLVRTHPDQTAGRFSASLYVHHANHGQFNTLWGNNDTGMIGGRLLNRSWLLSGEEQRRVGGLYLTAFIESALERTEDIPELFCDPGSAGRLLPETLYAARCDDGRRVLLADFEQGLDITRSGVNGVRLEGKGLDLWAERDIGFRGNSQRRQTGVFLGWRAVENAADEHMRPAYRVQLEPRVHQRLSLGESSVLWLDLAHLDSDPPPRLGNVDEAESQDQDGRESEKNGEEDELDSLRPPLNITVALEDADGNVVARPLSDFANLLPPLPVRHARLDLINQERFQSPTEPLLQSLAIPLAAFIADGVRPDRLESIELQFDNVDSGVLVIERMAITPREGQDIP